MDVSFASGQPGQARSVTGIGRVVTELTRRIASYPDLDVHCVGSFAGDWNPVVTDEQASRWVQEQFSGSPPYRCCYDSRFGLASRFASRFTDWSGKALSNCEEGCGKLPRSTNLLRRLSRLVLEADTRPAIDARNTDVFVATFRPSPDWLAESIPRVVFVYDVYPARFPTEAGSDVRGMLNRVLNSIVPTRDIVIVNSQFTRNDFCELTGHPSERVHVAYLAANDRFAPVTDCHAVERVRQRYQIGKQSYCLSVANPQPRKDLATAIRAFASAARALPAWDGCLVLAGNISVGWGYESIQTTIAEFPDLAGRIISVGTVAEEDLPALYSNAFAFLFPSRFEGFGLPVLEAMSCGVPVISSNATSLPEVGGKAPIYCEPGDVDSFAKAILSLVVDSTLPARMREAGISRAAQFSWNRFADHVHAAILHAAGQRIPTSAT